MLSDIKPPLVHSVIWNRYVGIMHQSYIRTPDLNSPTQIQTAPALISRDLWRVWISFLIRKRYQIHSLKTGPNYSLTNAYDFNNFLTMKYRLLFDHLLTFCPSFLEIKNLQKNIWFVIVFVQLLSMWARSKGSQSADF